MKFVPRDMGEAADASSAGPGGMRREIAILLGASALFLTVVYFSIGWVVELALPRISVERERAWFGGFIPGLKSG